jgi:hypothetical protein
MHIRFCFLSATLAAGFGLLAFPSAAPAQNPGSELIAAMELPEAPRAQQTPAGGQINQQEQPRTPQVLLAFDASSRGEAIPLTAGQKLKLALRSATSPFAFGKPFVVAGYHEVLDQDTGFGWGAEGYGKRAGAAYLNSFDSTMIGDGILPSLLHQEPRYFRLGYGTVRHRGLYAVAQVFRCHHDGARQWEPNYSNLGGNLIAGALSDLYYPSDETGAGQAISQGMTSIAWSAAGPLFAEFWPDISRKFLHKNPTHGLDAQADAAKKQAQEQQK